MVLNVRYTTSYAVVSESLNYLLVLLLHSSGGESLVSEESRAHSLSAHLSVLRGLLDPVSVGLLVLVVICVVLRLCHTELPETRIM